MAQNSPKENSRLRVNFSLIIDKVVIKIALPVTIPLLVSSFPKLPTPAPTNVETCPQQISKVVINNNADIA